MNPKIPTARDIIIKISRVKEKDRILKAVREKQLGLYKEIPYDYQQNLQQKFCRPEGRDMIYSKCWKKTKNKNKNENKKLPTKNTLPGKVIIQN